MCQPAVSQSFGETQTTDIPTDSYSESPLLEVAAFNDGHFTAQEGAWAIEDLM
jgi:hypothetical protein